MINAQRVNEIFMDCLFSEKEVKDQSEIKFIEVEGILCRIRFHPERLESYREEIEEMLLQLPLAFRSTDGGGWSFLKMVLDQNDKQWGEQQTADELCMLGMGLGYVKIQLPREIWNFLPGSVPYLMIDMEKIKKGD